MRDIDSLIFLINFYFDDNSQLYYYYYYNVQNIADVLKLRSHLH